MSQEHDQRPDLRVVRANRYLGPDDGLTGVCAQQLGQRDESLADQRFTQMVQPVDVVFRREDHAAVAKLKRFTVACQPFVKPGGNSLRQVRVDELVQAFMHEDRQRPVPTDVVQHGHASFLIPAGVNVTINTCPRRREAPGEPKPVIARQEHVASHPLGGRLSRRKQLAVLLIGAFQDGRHEARETLVADGRVYVVVVRD